MKKLVVFFNLLCVTLYSQQITNPEWRNYTNSETTRAIVEEDNYLWIGTEGGLVKFDKTTHQKIFYNKGNSFLPSNYITSIAIDSSGYKWLCTYKGLVKFKDEDWVVFNKENSGLPNSPLLFITIDNEGTKWIGTRDSGLVMYDDENWIVYNQQNSSLNSNIILTLKVDNDIIWIGTYQGLYKRENNEFKIVSVVGNRSIRCIDKDIHQNIWLGTASGLFKLVGNDNLTMFTSDIITSLRIDNHNVKWFGTGVNYYPYVAGMRNLDSAETQITINNLVNSATDYPWFFSILLESSGVRWFGSANGLVKVEVNGEFINLSNSMLGRDYVTKLFIDNHNRKWFYAWGSIPLSVPVLPPGYLSSFANDDWRYYNGTNSPVNIGGVAAVSDFNATDMFFALYHYFYGYTELYKYSVGTWTQISLPQTQYDVILYMWYDKVTGQLWVDFAGANGENNLFITYDGNNWIPVPNYPVYDINKMKRLNNLIWIASPQGLIKYNGSVFTLYNTSNSGLPSNYISSVDFDSEGNIWAGTSKGLVKFDGTNWIVYDRNNSPLSCDNITGMAIDSLDNIFIGTQTILYPYPTVPSVGLVKFDGNNWTFFTSDNSGKPDIYAGGEEINDLSIDETGKVWIATEGGIGVYDEDGIPVPVEFLSFNSTVYNNDVTLKWTTSTETNNQGFEIERKKGFDNWQKLGFVNGKGTTTVPQAYSFVDENLQAGKYQYRLKQIDFDGTFEYSVIVEVEITPTKFSLQQNYPNPFNPSTSIQYAIGYRQLVTLKVFDVLGNEVATLVNEEKPAGSYNVQFTINNVQLSSGIYFYQLKAGHYVETKKMILLK